MKNTTRLMILGVMCCSAGCNGTTVTTGNPDVKPAPAVKQTSQPLVNGKSTSPTAPAAPKAPVAPAAPKAPVAPAAPKAPAAPATTVLEGTWSTGCVAMGTVYLESSLTFVGNEGYSNGGGAYTDSACTTPMAGTSGNPYWLTITIGETESSGLTEFSDVRVDTTGTKTQEYNVFQITNGDTLAVGDASDVAGQYPTATDPKLVYKKQAKADAIPPQP